MKTTKFIKIILLMLLLPVIFIGGVYVGNIYNMIDILCPAKAESYILEQAFISDDGIVIPKGTVVALRQCAYMQRFNYEFAIDNAITIKQHKNTSNTNFGFAVLYPKDD